VKTRALELLAGPLQAAQVPIRIAAIDAVNSIVNNADAKEIGLPAVRALDPCVRSGNNGVRIPAVHAVAHAVKGSGSPAAYQAAMESLSAAMDSNAMIGGMEVRMMAVAALESIGVDASDIQIKGQVLGLLKLHAEKAQWEPEARNRAAVAATAVQNSIRQQPTRKRQNDPTS
jgi:hypothetical protein